MGAVPFISLGWPHTEDGAGGMALLVRDLYATYQTPEGPVHAVDDAEMSLEDGKSMGVVGESACGKSTLGLALLRMLPTARVSGTVVAGGESMLDMSEVEFDSKHRWKSISMVFQGAMNSLDPVFTIREQFEEILDRHKFGGSHSLAIEGSVRSVGLDESVLAKYPHELSGGMKQRVVIAMALILKPKIVVADEPTTSLDILVQAQILNLLKGLKEQGVSFVLITHDLPMLSEIADSIAVMYGGQVVELGSSEQIYRNPRHPYTRMLLESVPRLRGDPPKPIPGEPPDLSDPPVQCRFLDRCPLAVEKCKRNPPKFKTDTGYVRCWLEEEQGLLEPGAS